MSQANVDPGELRRFANNLRQFNMELHERLSALNSQLQGLSQSWRDREHEKFSEEFQQTMQVLSRFIEVADEHVPFLVRKADRAEEYLRQR